MVVNGAVENHVGLVFYGGRSAQMTGAFMSGGPSGLGQVAFPFDAKVMAIGSKATERKTVLTVGDFKQVGGRMWIGQVTANVLQVIGKFVGTGGTAAAGCC